MTHGHVKYLLVGGGLAAGSAAEAIRRVDPVGSAMLVGQEVSRPYHRSLLSKEYLRGEISKADLSTEPVGWFAERDIALRTGVRVAHIDVGRHCAALSNGEEIIYDQLLLATGAVPKPLKIPGVNLPNVYQLRHLLDADRLTNALERAKKEGLKHSRGRGRAAVIGASTLGVELASTFTQLNIAVDLFSQHPHPWRLFAGEATGKLIARHLEHNGIALHLNTRLEKLDGDGRVQRIHTLDGEVIPVDFVVIAIGTIPNRDIIRNTPIAAEKAILVDERCRTNVPDVYAAGDCCAIFDPLFGKYRVMQNWDHARISGAIAGANMAGGSESYDVVNVFDSRLLSIKMTAWGEAKAVSHRLIRGTPTAENPDCIEFGVGADGRLAQIIAIGHKQEHRLLHDLVWKRFNVTGFEDALRDTSVPLVQSLSRSHS